MSSVARRVGLLLAAAIAVQLGTAVAIATALPTKSIRSPDVTSAELLIDTLRLDKERPSVDYSLDLDGFYRRCGVEPDALGRGDENAVNMGPWSPSSARSLLSAQLQSEQDRWSRGTIDYCLAQTTTEFERRFLVGCIQATVFAPVCRMRAEKIVGAAQEKGPLPDALRRMDWYGNWNAQTMYLFVHGAAREHLYPEMKK